MTMTDLITAAIENKDIIVETAKVEVSAKASPDGKVHEKEYSAYRPQTLTGMLALCNGKVEPSTAKPEGKDAKDERTDEQKAAGVCDYFDYAYDLEQRAKIRAQIMATLEGPDKAIEKAAKQLEALVTMGLMDREEADAQMAKVRARAAA